MGIIITKFKKKKTTFEVLEKLDNEIKAIEEYGRSTEQTRKKYVGRFIVVSVSVYITTALIFYFYFYPASAYERILYIIPLIILPVLLIFVKKIMTWYYNKKMRKNEKKLSSLKEEKKKILEDVMDKETYKVAQKILEKFAPEQVRKSSLFNNDSSPLRQGVPINSGVMVPSSTGLRYRGINQPQPSSSRFSLGGPITPVTTRPSISNIGSVRPAGRSLVPLAGPNVPGSPLPLPRGILPRERTVLDKMVDYLVGDGPSNRYALICRNCSSHNGMALKEEFEYLSFRCCYCLMFNPSRKKRPAAPKLDVTLPLKAKSSDSEKSSGSDSESDLEGTQPVVTEPSSDSPVEEDTVRDNDADVRESSSDVEKSSLDAMEVDDIVEGEVVKDVAKEDINTESITNECDPKGDANPTISEAKKQSED